LLGEHGYVYGQGMAALRRGVLEVLERGALPGALAEAVGELLEEVQRLSAQVKDYERRIRAATRRSAVVDALEEELAGVGLLSASALACKVADPRVFANGRQFAASLGMVPRQHSTGGKVQLGSLTKTGDRYVRALLIHGARSVLRRVGDKQDDQSRWLRALVARAGFNKACVALAHRNARRAWAIMVKHAS
jgi:transposase